MTTAKCLNPGCTATRPRQLRLNAAQQLRIAEPWSPLADRCTFCGAVHYNSLFTGRELKGYLDGLMTPSGWVPIDKLSASAAGDKWHAQR